MSRARFELDHTLTLDSQDISLPHTPRSLVFPIPTTLFICHNTHDYTIITLNAASSPTASTSKGYASYTASELLLPSLVPPSAPLSPHPSNGVGVSNFVMPFGTPPPSPAPAALAAPPSSLSSLAYGTTAGLVSGFGGYGLGAAAAALGGLRDKIGYGGMARGGPAVIRVGGGEVCVVKEGQSDLAANSGQSIHDHNQPRPWHILVCKGYSDTQGWRALACAARRNHLCQAIPFLAPAHRLSDYTRQRH